MEAVLQAAKPRISPEDLARLFGECLGVDRHSVTVRLWEIRQKIKGR